MKTAITRKDFIKRGLMTAGTLFLANSLFSQEKTKNIIMTVNGPVSPDSIGFTLIHEHVLADFIGAEQYIKSRYNADEVYNTALPFLLDVKAKGCKTFVDCSPAYLGRDVEILDRLAKASGLTIITNTGYYGAVNEKFLPPQAYSDTASQLADRWIDEWKNGIDGTQIKPGFIKTSVDESPLTPTQKKLIAAAAITHLSTGLTIAVHTGDAKAHLEQLEILKRHGVAPSAKIWVHAQNESEETYHIEAAKNESWVSFDGVNPDSITRHIELLKVMKANNLLDHVLVSQDSGWYNVGEPKGGLFKPYTCIATQFIPALLSNGFTKQEIKKIFEINPMNAFTIQVRKL